MRRCLAILLAAALAAAEDDREFARIVDVLVRALGSPDPEQRDLARTRLAAYGDRVKPLLERVDSDDPDVRRTIRRLLRSGGKERLELLPLKDGAVPIGGALSLDVQIVNPTDQTLQLLPDVSRQGEFSPFRVRFGPRSVAGVRFDQVDWGEAVVIQPGGSRRFRLTLDPNEPALRRPALYDISVIFDGTVARGYGTVDPDAVENGGLVLESAPVQVHVLGQKAEELEKALASDDARQKATAVRELSLRDDEAVVPILRRHARERPLRLAAIKGLGAAGAPEDFDLIFEATRDEDAEVRRAAVLGLSKFGAAKLPAPLLAKARARLLQLASDHELQKEAIRALRGHKHQATIDCYLKLLGTPGLTDDSSREIRATIAEWTGLRVSAQKSEIDAFRTWWEASRRTWAEQNASGK